MIYMIEPSRNYRLGDLVSGYIDRGHIQNPERNPSSHFFCENWPDSIGCEYVLSLNSTKNTKLVVFKHIIEKRNQNATFLKNDVVVVHLRLGDVLDLPYYRYKRVSIGRMYVRPLTYYLNLKIPKSVKYAYIVTNVSYRTYGKPVKSYEYFKNVTDILQARGLKVSCRHGKTPDEDFLFMTRAFYFVKSGGGFSNLVSHIVRMYNHTVL